MSTPSPQQDKSGNGEPAATLPSPKGSLWVLEKADTLVCEVAVALWLAIASVWRIPVAAIKRNSMGRLDALVAKRQVLPPRLSLLVAAIVSALLLSFLLPDRTPHPSFDGLLRQLAT